LKTIFHGPFGENCCSDSFSFTSLFLLHHGRGWILFPALAMLLQYWYQLMDWAVELSNKKIFHVRDVLVPDQRQRRYFLWLGTGVDVDPVIISWLFDLDHH
jgi:hypothetical protein